VHPTDALPKEWGSLTVWKLLIFFIDFLSPEQLLPIIEEGGSTVKDLS